MREIGNWVQFKGKDNIITKMGTYTTDNSKMGLKVEEGNTHLVEVANTRASGKMAKCMEKE